MTPEQNLELFSKLHWVWEMNDNFATIYNYKTNEKLTQFCTEFNWYGLYKQGYPVAMPLDKYKQQNLANLRRLRTQLANSILSPTDRNYLNRLEIQLEKIQQEIEDIRFVDLTGFFPVPPRQDY